MKKQFPKPYFSAEPVKRLAWYRRGIIGLVVDVGFSLTLFFAALYGIAWTLAHMAPGW